MEEGWLSRPRLGRAVRAEVTLALEAGARRHAQVDL
jgi:hypothetical protein